MRRPLQTLLIVGLVLCFTILAGAEELKNDSRITAVAVRVTFNSRVRITDYGREFGAVEPSSGISDVFVFTGGNLRRNQTFEIEWAPGTIRIKSVEWLEVYGEEQQEAMELVRTCTRVLSPGDDLQARIEQAYDGMEICLEPGTYEVEHYVRISADIRIRGLGDSPDATQITCPNYSYAHISSDGEADVRIENLSFVIPKYASGSIGATENSRLQLENVWVADSSDFEFAVVDQATMQVSQCRAFSVSALHQSQLVVSETSLDGDLGTEYEFRGVSAYHESEVTLSDCTISHYRYALNMEQESKLTMTDCSVTDIEREFFDCDDFTGSILGSGNSIDAPLGECSDSLPSGFRVDGPTTLGSEQQEETPSGSCILPPPPHVTTVQLNSQVVQFAFSPDGGTLLAIHGNWSGTQISTTTWEGTGTNGAYLRNACFSPDGSLVASRRGVYLAGTYERIWNLEATQGVPLFAPDGESIVLSRSPASVWDLATQTQKVLLPIAFSWPVTITDDGKTLWAVSNADGTLTSCDIETGVLLTGPTPLDANAFRFSPDGRRLALWSHDGMILVQDLASDRQMIGSASLEGEYGYPNDIAFTSNEHVVAVAIGGTIFIYTVSGGGALIAQLEGDPVAVQALAVSPDGSLLVAGGKTGRVDVWDISAVIAYSCP